jgi:RND superfamily putative drug exporter
MKTPKKWFRIALPSVVIVVWLALAGIGGPYFGKIGDVSSTDLTTFLPSSAESTKVNDELTKFRDDKTIPLIIVFNRDGAALTESDVASAKDVNTKLAQVDGVAGKISPPITSEDNKALFTALPLKSDGDFKEIFSTVKTELANAHLPVAYSLTGPASFAHDLQGAFAGIDGTLLLVALGVVFVILLIVYRSPILPFIVLLTSITALAAAIFVVYYLAKADIIQLNGQVQGILFILVIGAATDYSLLYISRFREELGNFKTSWEATRVALRSSFEPILAAGGTVTVGLLCLLFSDLGSNKALGPVGGIGIVLSIAAALTLLPALLLCLGRTVFWPRKPKYAEEKDHHDYEKNHPVWVKVGALARRHPRRIWVGSSVLLLVACIGVFQLKADGVSQGDLILGKSEARDGQKILDAHFAAGSGSPALITAPYDKQDAVVAAIEANKGVSSVSATATGVDAGTMPIGTSKETLQKKILTQVTATRNGQLTALRSQLDQQMKGLPQAVVDAAFMKASAGIPSAESIAEQAYPFKDAKEKNVDGRVLLQVTLVDAADSLAARETIVQLREQLKQIDNSTLVGGTSAAQYDTNQAALRDERIIIPLILVAITIILMFLLRAIVAPLVLLVTTVLSFGATLGTSAFLFNHLWHFPGADPSVVIFGFVFLVALGIDYNIFLMTRVREETIKSGVSLGTIKGLVVTGGVITSAGVVLAATFASLSVIPILFLAQLAFIVAFGVLLDTLIVRSLLVPTITLEVDRRMWWPSKLWRRLWANSKR